MNKVFSLLLVLFLLGGLLVGCSPKKQSSTKEKITVMLDWAPNTNHTGLFVAQSEGYFKEEGLDVEFVQPSGTDPLAVVATQKADFGVSSQEGLIQSRVQGLPVVSIAAIIQHNTSGFASLVDKKITRPKSFENKIFGGFGFPVEKEMVHSVMEEDQGDPSKIQVVYTGNSDFFTAVKKNIDFMWIYYGWTGIEAKLRGIPINMVYLTDYSKDLDYYTPLLITNEKRVKKDPEVVRKFMKATTRGYDFAILHPDDGADCLLKENPSLDGALVRASQQWLSPRYQDDASQWGIQKKEVWNRYTKWLQKHDLLEGEFNIDEAFTNQFLPQKSTSAGKR